MLKLTVTSSGCKIFGDPLVNGEVMLTIFDDPSNGRCSIKNVEIKMSVCQVSHEFKVNKVHTKLAR